jgi:hypothetical protein
MTGELDMSSNTITNVANPVDETDVANKQYVDNSIGDKLTNVSLVGRYMVLHDQDDVKTYVSVRTQRNIDLDNGRVVEIKNNIADSDENEFNNNPRNIEIQSNLMLMPNPDKALGTVKLNGQIRVSFKPPTTLAQPWTFILMGKPGETPAMLDNGSIFTFIKSKSILNHIMTRWVGNRFEYAITDTIMLPENTDSFEIDPSRLNTIAFTYERNKLMIWLNGLPKKTKVNLDLGGLHYFRVGVRELGILSLYDRVLNRWEIGEYYVEHYVENFTNDEVLI